MRDGRGTAAESSKQAMTVNRGETATALTPRAAGGGAGPWRRRAPGLLLVALLLVQGAALWAFVRADDSMRLLDMGAHLELVGQAYHLVDQLGLLGVEVVARGDGPQLWPTAGYLPWVGVSLLLGLDITTLRLLNLVYLALALTMVFLVGRRLVDGWTGLCAAALLSLYPMFLGAGRQFGIDFPAAALCAACFYLLLRTRGFSLLPHTVVFGAGCAWAALTCPRSAFFLALPALGALVLGLRRGRVSRVRTLLHAAAGLAVAAGLSAPWWYGRLGALIRLFGQHRSGLGLGMVSEGSSALFFGARLPWLLTVPLTLALALALVLLVHRRVKERVLPPPERLLLGLWLLGGGTFSLAMGVHHLRHAILLLPPVALVTALGLARLRPAGLRRGLIGLFLLGGAALALADAIPGIGPVNQNWPADPLESWTGAENKGGILQPESLGGPPLRHPRLVATRHLAEALKERRGSSRGLVVLHNSGLGHRFRPLAEVRAVLGTALPGLYQPIIDYTEVGPLQAQRPVLDVYTAARLPLIRPRLRHCYNLVLSPDNGSDPRAAIPPDDWDGVTLKRVFDERFVEQPHEVRLTLWLRNPCLPYAR